MSKLAEKKALEAYPILKEETLSIDKNLYGRNAYGKGYDQAMQDIEEFFQTFFFIHPHDCHVVQYESDTPINSIDDLVEHFRNYTQDENNS